MGVASHKIRNSIIYFNYLFLLYILAFQPPIIDKYFLTVIQFAHFILLNIFVKNYLSEFYKYFRKEANILFILIIYVVLRDLFAGEIVYTDRFLAWTFQGFFYSFALISGYETVKSKKKLKLSMMDLLFIISIIAGVLTILLLMNPALDSFYSRISKMDEQDFYHRYVIRHRYYGVSDSLGYGYSYVMGIFAGYSLFLIFNGKIRYIISFITGVIAVWFNARIGLTVILFFFIYSLITNAFKFKNIVIIILMLFIVVNIFNYFNLGEFFFNSEWVMGFFYELSDVFFGTNYLYGNTTTGILLGDFIIWPETFSQWIFGRGESLFLKSGMNSDNGFILQLNYGGLILMFILFSLMILMIQRLRKIIGYKHYFLYLFLITIFIANTKGFLFASTPIGRMLFFLYVMYIYQNKLVKKSYNI